MNIKKRSFGVEIQKDNQILYMLNFTNGFGVETNSYSDEVNFDIDANSQNDIVIFKVFEAFLAGLLGV